MLAVVTALSALGRVTDAGLRDHAIGAHTVHYLDGAWTASASGHKPDGCRYEDGWSLALSTSMLMKTGARVYSREECCARCWAEALCTASLYSSEDGHCHLHKGESNGGATPTPFPGGGWTKCQLRRGSSPFAMSIPATVPGDLLSDLQAAGQIGDPLHEKNFLNSSIWHSHVWTYKAEFTPSDGILADARGGGRVQLVFDGIKMGANISLDGVLIGTALDQFYRYTFDVTKLLLSQAAHQLEVRFDPQMSVDGRFSACTGGWDWAPYSHTYLDGAHTFSKGLWKSVYLASTARASVAIEHVVPQITYRGAYPTQRLNEHKHAGFSVAVRVHFSAATATRGTLTLMGSWADRSRAEMVKRAVAIPAGESNATISTTATAADVQLWWPNGLGGQPLYSVTVQFVPERSDEAVAADVTGGTVAAAAAVSATRTIGFRYVALVTGNDTDPHYVQNASAAEGTSSHGMYLRVNGVIIFSRGANVIPMEELEGRLSSAAHEALVASAVAARFNMLRVWGGGMFLPAPFYDACDASGVLVYHDMQYAQQGHAPKATRLQEAELRHSIRRLSSHTSIVVWDGCNECRVVMGTPTAVYASFVMTIVAEEDRSRAVWPSCPALGWRTGVRMLDSLPNGRPLTTPPRGPTIETHGPYQHGSGFPAANGNPTLRLFEPLVPIAVASRPTGPALPNVFASEFGAVVMSSFESMAPTLAPEHWALHAGQPDDTCPGGFERRCVGSNVMAERNYPCDSMIDVYFGMQPAGYYNQSGEASFKRQLYQCMLSQAMHVKADIEARRSQNELGILVWQYNEIWPTGGWGSVEYGTPVAGQVLGGRWKPLHYLYRRSVFTDVMAACGAGGACYVKNDAAGEPFVGQVELATLEFATGELAVLSTISVQLAAGPGVSERFHIGASIDGTTHMLIATCYRLCDGGHSSSESCGTTAPALSVNEILLAPPKQLMLPLAMIDFVVASTPNPDGSVDIRLTASATALYVTLTTLAQGRFSDNAFAMQPGNLTVTFLPNAPLSLPTLAKTLRVEHLQQHLG